MQTSSYWQPRFIGRLTVRSEPEGARLFGEAGQDLGAAPREFDLVRGGSLRLTARLPGHLPATLATSVGLEEHQTVQIRLEEIPVPKPGQAFNIPELGLVLQWIRPGSFTIGSPPDEAGRTPDEGPLMRVAISQGLAQEISPSKVTTQTPTSSAARIVAASSPTPVGSDTPRTPPLWPSAPALFTPDCTNHPIRPASSAPERYPVHRHDRR